MNRFFNFFAFIFLIIITSCSEKDQDSISSEDDSITLENYQKITSLNYYIFDNKEDVMNKTLSSCSNSSFNLKSSISGDTIESMWDIQCKLEKFYSDTTATDEYIQSNVNSIVDEYSDIMEMDEDSTYHVVIYDPDIASKFNSNGILAVNDTIYLINKNYIYEYLLDGDDISLIKSQKRIITQGNIEDVELTSSTENSVTLKTSTNVSLTESGDWTSNKIYYRLKVRRKVQVWLYVQHIGDLGAKMGAVSLYWKHSGISGNWRHGNGENSLKFVCSSFTYVNGKTSEDVTITNVESKEGKESSRYLHAADSYTNMDYDESYTIVSPIVTFYWKVSDCSNTGYVFTDFKDE